MSDQQSRMEGFRSRAGLLLSSAAVTTSFLAGQGLRGGNTSAFGWLALLDFAAVAALSLAIHSPSRREVAADPGRRPGRDRGSRDRVVDDRVSAAETYRELAAGLQRIHDDNSFRLNRLAVFFQLASSLLVIEVILWVATIATVA